MSNVQLQSHAKQVKELPSQPYQIHPRGHRPSTTTPETSGGSTAQTKSPRSPRITGGSTGIPVPASTKVSDVQKETFISTEMSSPHSGRKSGVTHVRTVTSQLRTIHTPHQHKHATVTSQPDSITSSAPSVTSSTPS